MLKLLSISILILLSLAMIAPVFALTGDVNGDGKVDMVDLYIVSTAFGTKPGDARWKSAADVNQDGRIDMIDMFTVAKNFGQHV